MVVGVRRSLTPPWGLTKTLGGSSFCGVIGAELVILDVDKGSSAGTGFLFENSPHEILGKT